MRLFFLIFFFKLVTDEIGNENKKKLIKTLN
jgi:hypothetical protein